MIQKLKSLVTKLSIASLLVMPVMAPVAVYAQEVDPQGSLCKGAKDLEFGGTATCDDTVAAEETVNDLVATIINVFSVVVGIVAVMMIIWGGFKYITSGGDSGNIGTAKNTILFAIVGLIIVAMAQIIVQFVLSRATNVE